MNSFEIDAEDFPSNPFLALSQANAIIGDNGNTFRSMNKGITPQFFVKFEANPRKSELEGRPICDEVELCRILIAGDNQNEHVEPVTEATIRRFPEAYAAWKAGRKKRLIEGTPLRQWPAIPAIKVAELEALNVFSVEALAGLADNLLGRGFDLRDWRTKAQAWLDQAKDTAAVMRYAAEAERMRDEVKRMADDIKRMPTDIEGLRAENEALRDVNVEMRAENAEMRKQFKRLAERIGLI